MGVICSICKDHDCEDHKDLVEMEAKTRKVNESEINFLTSEGYKEVDLDFDDGECRIVFRHPAKSKKGFVVEIRYSDPNY